MGIIKRKDLVGWQAEDGKIYCNECVDFEQDSTPLTKDDVGELFEKDDILICDGCNKRIW